MANEFGEYLRSLLNEAKITQADLSRKTGIHTVTLNKILTGKFRNGYTPEADTIEKIALAVPCALNDHINLYRKAGKVPKRIIDLFVADEKFAVTIWEAWQQRTADKRGKR